MKNPWVLNICCGCCRGSSSKPAIENVEAGKAEIEKTELAQDHEEVNEAQRSAPDSDTALAERAIDSALRLSFHSNRSRGVEEDLPEDKLHTEPPPPSYDTVLKDNDRRTPRAVSRTQQQTEEIQPARLEPGVLLDHDRKTGNQESVLSSGDSDLVLTPPTTAPPTVIDEDSEDDERFYPSGRPAR